MTPKEKAIELVENFLNNIEDRTGTFLLSNYSAKQCALIAVDEVINIAYWAFMESGGKQEQEFWQEVKIEIEKL